MGQQQILLIVLSVILVGIAVSVGITMFRAQAEQNHYDMIASDLSNLAMQALQYYLRPTILGGGSNSFWVDENQNFEKYFDSLPSGFRENENATYVVAVVTDQEPNDTVLITAESNTYYLDNVSPPERAKRWMSVNRVGELTLYTTEPSFN